MEAVGQQMKGESAAIPLGAIAEAAYYLELPKMMIGTIEGHLKKLRSQK